MKKFEKELLFSQVEGETTTGSGNGTTGENAGEGENDAPEQEPVDEGAEDDNNMYDGQDGTSSGQTPDGQGNSSSEQTQDGQNSSSSGQNPEGQGADSGYDLEEDIPSITIIGHPPVDNDEPEEPIEESNDDGEEYEDNNENDDDTQSSTEQSEEETEEVDYIIPPLAQSLTNRPPEAVANGFCLLGCCMWAFYKIFGIRPVFNFVKSIADAVTNNGFNGIGYNNRFDISILQDICNRYIYELNLQIYLTIRIPKVEQGELYPDITPYIPELRYYLNNNAGVIGIYSTSNHSEHAVLITDIDDNGYYKYIDPVTATEYAGDQPLKDSKFNRFYSIINR